MPESTTQSTIEQRDRLLDSIPLLLSSIGRENFASAWLKCINDLVTVDQFGISVFDAGLKPRIVCRATLPGQEQIGSSSAQIYLKHFYYYDPCITAIKDSTSKESVTLFRMRAADVPNPEYRKQVYDRYQLRERISYIGQMGNIWYAINLFRRAPNKSFSDQDLSLINEFHDHFIESAAHHVELISPDIWDLDSKPKIEFLQGLVSELGCKLSPREVEVCARSLSGMTKTGIALDLRLKPTTVNTLTQRAYRKLSVSSINEMFALCLRVLALRSIPGEEQE